MAERRMFSRAVVESDRFCELPPRAQLLYYHLLLDADDHGFVGGYKRVLRTYKIPEKDRKALEKAGFIHVFASGVVLVMHFCAQNQISPSKRRETEFPTEAAQVELVGGKVYRLKNPENSRTNSAQHSIGEMSIDQYSGVESNAAELPAAYGRYKNIHLTDWELTDLKERFPKDWEKKIDRISSVAFENGRTYPKAYTTILRWAEEDEEKARKKPSENPAGNFTQRAEPYADYRFTSFDEESGGEVG